MDVNVNMFGDDVIYLETDGRDVVCEGIASGKCV